MSFQLCPLCKGSGRQPSFGLLESDARCTVCMGLKIIDEKTGRAPTVERLIDASSQEGVPVKAKPEHECSDELLELIEAVGRIFEK